VCGRVAGGGREGYECVGELCVGGGACLCL